MRALLLFVILFPSILFSQTNERKSMHELLCAHSWKMIKMTDINGSKRSMDANFLSVITTFNRDGTLSSNSKGKITKDIWQLNEQDSTIITSQIYDPNSGQIKETIISINETSFIVQITYRGNNIMQYDYEATNE
jgi:hypothetical protein